MSTYTIIGIIVILVILLGGYYNLSSIGYTNYKPSVSSLYCSLAKTGNIPDYPTIFIPGLKGSQLSRDGEVVWLKTKQALQSQTDSPLTYFERDGVRPTGVFTRLVTIPFFAEFRGYHRVSVDMGCAPNGYTFYYDWRKAPQDIIPELDQLVDRVFKETGKKPALVSHSYGAVITRGYIQDSHEKVGPVVFIGGALDPGPGFLVDDLVDGARVFTNTDLLSVDVNASHESSYYLVPHHGNASYMEKDVSDANVWKEDKLGFYVNDDEYPLEDLQKKLDRAKVYTEKMKEHFSGDNQVLVVRNNLLETLEKVSPLGHRVVGVGDGRVSFESAMPFGIDQKQITEFLHPARHSQQTQSKEILREVYQFISENTN